MVTLQRFGHECNGQGNVKNLNWFEGWIAWNRSDSADQNIWNKGSDTAIEKLYDRDECVAVLHFPEDLFLVDDHFT